MVGFISKHCLFNSHSIADIYRYFDLMPQTFKMYDFFKVFFRSKNLCVTDEIVQLNTQVLLDKSLILINKMIYTQRQIYEKIHKQF